MATLIVLPEPLATHVYERLHGYLIRLEPPSLDDVPRDEWTVEGCAYILDAVERYRPRVVIISADFDRRFSLVPAGVRLARMFPRLAVVGAPPRHDEAKRRNAYSTGISGAVDLSACADSSEAADQLADHAHYARAWVEGLVPRLPFEQAFGRLRSLVQSQLEAGGRSVH